ncbi:MAG: hypothetical protein XXXJIFNMEKO3_02670 [Candidatus Erwinia impunctatus]|nr:hypothetical protein XXXJIFNMEKO_02670 [Culicoides impunctatus]
MECHRNDSIQGKGICNAIIWFYFTGYFFSSYTFSMSEDEQENYNKLKVDYDKSDSKLNHLYKKQLDKYKGEGGEYDGQKESKDIYLITAQQAWVRIRDADCNYETYESKTGTGFSSIYLKCILDKTNERIYYLKINK